MKMWGKLMKIILILVVSSFLFVSCAVGPFPTFPDIKNQYLIRVTGAEVPKVFSQLVANLDEVKTVDDQLPVGTVSCLKFDVVSLRPYQIKFVGVVDIHECNLVGGYKPSETQGILNWVDDVYEWAKDRKKCFKE